MNKLVVAALLVALCIAGARAAGPSDFFSAKDASEQIAAMKAVQDKKTGAFGSGIQDTAFAVDTLVQLGAEVPQKDLVCKYAEKGMRKFILVTDANNLTPEPLLSDGSPPLSPAHFCIFFRSLEPRYLHLLL